ncbi:hypothetical protein [Aquimarina algiphila]|uniref:hypothetical protein n=1 Tax=Aquimarina algiphila TaxID=2047982 RepID=UPI0023315271|nr:hypothetical protein [Aquimarina algiphila]
MYTDNGFKIIAFKVCSQQELETIYSGYIENPYDPDHEPTSSSKLWVSWDQQGHVYNLPDSFSIHHFISLIVRNNLSIRK